MIEARLLSEIFDLFEAAETKAEKQAILKKYWNPSMKLFLEYALNPNIKFDVIPPKTYRPAVEPAGLNVSYLDMEVNKLYRFIEGHPQRPAGLTPEKQTKLLTVVLESMHPTDSELLLKLIRKNLGVKGLTIKFIQDTFKA